MDRTPFKMGEVYFVCINSMAGLDMCTHVAAIPVGGTIISKATMPLDSFQQLEQGIITSFVPM